jgi:hypothetical protein
MGLSFRLGFCRCVVYWDLGSDELAKEDSLLHLNQRPLGRTSGRASRSREPDHSGVRRARVKQPLRALLPIRVQKMETEQGGLSYPSHPLCGPYQAARAISH